MTITIPRRPSWALLAVVAALAFFVPRIAGADHATAGRTLTGCLKTDGTVVKLRIANSPTSACTSGQQEVHLADGDVTAVVAGTGVAGGSSKANATVSVKPTFRLPQGCGTGKVGTWSGTQWICGEADPPSTLATGGLGGVTQPLDTLDPYLGMQCIISLFGVFPSPNGSGSGPFVGEVKWVPFDVEPQGWERCDGELLLISENEALFQVLGTTYGGDGQETFALPDARNRTFRGVGNTVLLGQIAGSATSTLTLDHMPSHTHEIP